MRVKAFDPETDRGAVEECLLELQEFSRQHDARLPIGSCMAQEYLERLHARCSLYAGKVLVAEIDAVVVGYVCVLAKVPAAEPADGVAEAAQIVDLVVQTNARGSGVGSCLLHAADTYAQSQGASWLRVGVFAWNAHAIGLYEHRGYARLEVTLEKRLPAFESENRRV